MAGAVLLGATAATPDLFLSSSATDALERSIAESTRYGAGVTVEFHDTLRARLGDGEERVSTVHPRDRALARVAARVPHLDDRVLTMVSGSISVSSDPAGAGGVNSVRLVHRTGSLEHIRPVAGAGKGAWIQDVTAVALGLEPGEDIFLEHAGGRVPVRVAGVYEALVDAPPSPFWEPLADYFRPQSPDAPLPPPFVLVDRTTYEVLADRLDQREADFQWEFPLEPEADLDLGTATDLVAEIRSFDEELRDTRSDVGELFVCRTCFTRAPIRLDFRSNLEQDVLRARETVDSLAPSIDLLAVAGLLTALVVLGAAGLYAVNRRRTEMRLLIARGASPGMLAFKSAVECTIPVVAGTACGIAASVLFVDRFGPGDKLDPASVADAGLAAAVTVPVALVVIGLVAGFSALQLSPGATRSSRRGWLLWEIPVLIVAGLALRQALGADGLVTGSSGSVSRVSVWLLAFPVLFVGAGGGLAARAFRRLLNVLRTPRLRVGPSLYLSLNRLASARSLAIMLITASALAFGVFLYAQTMAESIRETTTAKSYVFTGSDVAVSVDRQYSSPASFELPHTVVSSKLDGGRLEPSGHAVDFLAVDPSTFERAAYWDESFSTEPLARLMDGLQGRADGSLRVVVSGAFPDDSILTIGGVTVPYEVVARVDAFPGQFLARPLLVVNRQTAANAFEAAGALNPLTSGGTGGLWIKGDTGRVLASLADLGFAPDDALTASATLQSSSFVAVSRTFGFLEGLGALAALLVMIGIVLYVQTRQRARTVSYALARRMGLRAGSHFAALVVELVTMLAVSLIAGCLLGATAARLVYARVDLLPDIPPQPLLRIPLAAALPIVAGVIVTAAAGAFLAHRSAERADVTKALRSGA